MKRTFRRILLVAIALVILGVGYYHYKFPYGWSHCCDKQLAMALYQYAETHNGWFPRGEECPEASLSLLYREDPLYAYMLRGKIVPLDMVRARLESGQLLTPETCGWHYVEGLRFDDDSRLALFWDKVGLGHNGERLSRGGHSVGFIDGTCRNISGDEWDAFLAEQEKLRAWLKR